MDYGIVIRDCELYKRPNTTKWWLSTKHLEKSIKFNPYTIVKVDPKTKYKTRPLFGREFLDIKPIYEDESKEAIVEKSFLCSDTDICFDAKKLKLHLYNTLKSFKSQDVVIKNCQELLESIQNHCPKKETDPDIKLVLLKYYKIWLEIVLPKVLPEIIKRCNRDTELLIKNKLIKSGEKLKEVEFSGSDFHKGSQQVVFLYFDKGSKIVYKPGNLNVDKLLFGEPLHEEKFESFAELLNPVGNLIPRYTIIPIENIDNDKNNDYGYMQFVETELPTKIVDLYNIYKSIAANMAFSLIVGLEDIHYDNIVIRKNKIQLIDMEAISGYSDINNNWVTSKLWNKGIHDPEIREKDGTIIPKSVKSRLRVFRTNPIFQMRKEEKEIQESIIAAFNSVLIKRPKLKNHKLLKVIDNQTARTVPIATEWFSNQTFMLVIDKSKREDFLAGIKKYNSGIVSAAKGLNKNIKTDFIVKVLQSFGTYSALERMDVPFYYNKLGADFGGNKITDEEGKTIVAKDGDFSKLTGPISKAINKMLNMDSIELTESFKKYGMIEILNLNNELFAKFKSKEILLTEDEKKNYEKL